ncbi:MAG: hypothetical protein PHC33_04660 [Candidatus Omnitrophica bacterium]|nr:hypothetical protein [Candidatus Omnitrophota bacterium]
MSSPVTKGFPAVCLAAVCMCVFVSAALCEDEIFLSPEDIIFAEKRGMEIAQYEKAAMKATDMLLELKPDRSKLGMYIAYKAAGVWKVYFGRISGEAADFQPAYVFACPADSPKKMKAVSFSEIPAEVTQRARAVNTAVKAIEFDARGGPYNTSVFREEDGMLTVYLLPGNKNPDVVLLGGDFKVSVSSDGSQAVRKIPLHRTVLEIPSVPKEGKPAGSFHTHIMDDLPTETDVAQVILYPSLAPHSILGREWFSQIDKNGRIIILGRTKEILLH